MSMRFMLEGHEMETLHVWDLEPSHCLVLAGLLKGLRVLWNGLLVGRRKAGVQLYWSVRLQLKLDLISDLLLPKN